MVICEFCAHRWHEGCRFSWCQCRHAGPEEAAGAAVYRLGLRRTAEILRSLRPVVFTLEPDWNQPDFTADRLAMRMRYVYGFQVNYPSMNLWGTV